MYVDLKRTWGRYSQPRRKTATKLVPVQDRAPFMEACSPSLRSGRPKMAVPFWRILQNATKDQGRKPAKLCKNAVQWWSMNIFHVKVTWIGFQFILMGNHARVKWNSWNGEFDQKSCVHNPNSCTHTHKGGESKYHQRLFEGSWLTASGDILSRVSTTWELNWSQLRDLKIVYAFR